MRRALNIHPDSRCPAVAHIDAEATRSAPGALALRYVVTGRIGDLLLPPMAAPIRADGLWRHTCFEAFVRVGAGYFEFNFAPSTQWAVYRFDGYRTAMAPLLIASAPHIAVHASETILELNVALASGALPADAPWRLGLSAVIEDAGGAKSYWALAHPPGAPDFHHADCFALELLTA